MRTWTGVGLSLLLAGCWGAALPSDPPEDAVESAESSPGPETLPADNGDWIVNRSTNPFDDSTTVVSILPATEGVGSFNSDPIALVARCQSNITEVYVNWHDFLGDDDLRDVRSPRKRVMYRFPPAAATTELWGVSTDNETTFVAHPIPFLRTLVASERLVMQTTPHGESPTLAVFDLAAGRAAIEPISDTCNWILDAEEAARADEEREQTRRAEQRRQERARQAELAARRAEQERQEHARRAELEEMLADAIRNPFPASRLMAIGRVDSETLAQRGLPDGVRVAYFVPGISVSRLMIARRQGQMVACAHGELAEDGITLRGCDITE